jgi:hypothetical protein
MPPPLFSLGQTVATPGALEALKQNLQTADEFLTRHQNGDWGDISKQDANENIRSLKEGSRILSAYRLRNGTQIWVISEADRSSTCILLPEEY